MSGQSRDINLIHHPHEAGYRLLELPPDLANLLESDTAPVLTLESSDTSAVLRTPDKSYYLKQKNTSNALFLLSPSTVSGSSPQDLAIISTIHETVELEAIPEFPLADHGIKH
ncbi:Sister chromatid cohesion protein DCC1 [Moelleriella libera RCEF 2490]|uniref:Sister chromatid cohesion protein DCC1 n=1 Tax=Moelleriella libera RCEF 2490 TaxID=1081109 RepID=A0A168BJB6_9HYPO|nr:Sister chromatid cohesion protein DCC1 [Moelleriella libera RCEF 2490]